MGLTAKRVAKLLRRGVPGRHFDGDGLYLDVTGKDTGNYPRRYELRRRALDRPWIRQGSPKHASATERSPSFSPTGLIRWPRSAPARPHCWRPPPPSSPSRKQPQRFVAQADAGWSSRRHAAEYLSTLQRYAWPHLGALDVAEIDVPHVLAVLEQKVTAAKGYPAGVLWEVRAVSADRLRNRIETVLSWCAARGHRPKGPNPAAWASNLEHILPKPSRVARVKPFAAVPHPEVPVVMAQLKTRAGVAVKALMFTILETVRSGETLNATWGEINFKDAIWIIPPERMKSRKEHRVPLSPQAIALLQDLPREEGNPHVFIGARNAALGEAAMSATLKRLGRSETVHGFRSAFSTWAHEQTAHSSHTIEMCLAHAVGSEVERAYRRGDLFEKRRKLMEQWARYVMSAPAAGAVVPLRKGALA